jgi:hypothetical protein
VNLQMDSEGGVQPKSQNRVIAPLVLTLLAGRALDDGSQVAKALLHPMVSALWAGLSVWRQAHGTLLRYRHLRDCPFLLRPLAARGHDVVFVKNTRIEITTTPTHSPLNTHDCGEVIRIPPVKQNILAVLNSRFYWAYLEACAALLFRSLRYEF